MVREKKSIVIHPRGINNPVVCSQCATENYFLLLLLSHIFSLNLSFVQGRVQSVKFILYSLKFAITW
jgi:hypothetical protein